MPTGVALSDDDIAEIIGDLATGSTLKQACQRAEVNYTNVVERIRKSERLTELHTRAREEYAHYKVQQMHDIAVDEPDVQRARLRIDCIKWEAARVLPKQYGERVNVDGDIKHSHTILDAIRLAAGSGEGDQEVETGRAG